MRETPSAEELEWIAQMRMHLERACETSPRMRKNYRKLAGNGQEMVRILTFIDTMMAFRRKISRGCCELLALTVCITEM